MNQSKELSGEDRSRIRLNDLQAANIRQELIAFKEFSALPGYLQRSGAQAVQELMESSKAPEISIHSNINDFTHIGSGGEAEVFAIDIDSKKYAIRLRLDTSSSFKKDDPGSQLIPDTQFAQKTLIFDKNYTVSRYLAGSSLSAVLKKIQPNNEDNIDILRFVLARECFRSVQVFNANKKVHRDINPRNMIIHRNTTDNGNLSKKPLSISLIDNAHTVNEGLYKGMERVITPYFTAPESWKPEQSTSSNTFQLGCVLFQVLSGARTTPISDLTRSELKKDGELERHFLELNSVHADAMKEHHISTYAPVFDHYPALKELLIDMLKTDPEERINITEARRRFNKVFKEEVDISNLAHYESLILTKYTAPKDHPDYTEPSALEKTEINFETTR